ncbi:MAG: NUDIX domain-containing protein [Clostridia bacterium]|nr:NUDIX domain-containing protein [Clostridia bacterium]
MLGKIVDVLIDHSAYGRRSRFFPPFYCGHIINGDSYLYRKKVYVISNNPEEKLLKGVIIALVNKGRFDYCDKIIVAPIGSIYYSPEIRSRLSRVQNQAPFYLTCLYEKSCGAIIYEIRGNTRYFLLVKNKLAKNWGFPKGHIEIGETEEQTAKREIKEETNLDVTILKGFRKKSFYKPYGKIKKKVVIFLAKSSGNKVKVQNNEIACYKWLRANDALNTLKYSNDIEIFKSALNWLNRFTKPKNK